MSARNTQKNLICLFMFIIFLAGPRGWTSGNFQDKQHQKVPRHDAYAILKLVSVRVLNQDGKPVMDLAKEDFILYDNDKPANITEFEVHKLGMSKEESPAYVNKDVIYEGKRKYFILIDMQGSGITGTANSKKAALHFVETKVRPGDEVCVFSYAPMSGMTMQEYLTADKERIIKAIKRSKETRTFPGEVVGGETEKKENKAAIKEMLKEETGKDVRGDFSRGEGYREAKEKVEAKYIPGPESSAVPTASLGKYRRNPVDFRACLSYLSEMMQYVPGNKCVLFFSSRSFGRKIGRQFASSNTPVFTVNSLTWKNRGAWTFQAKQAHKWVEQELKELAVATGGHYFPDVKNIADIAETVDHLTSNIYVLGYYIDQKWDGQYHKIKLEVQNPAYQVFVQDGYFNPRPFSQLSDAEKKLHLYDLAFTEKPVALDPFTLPVEVLHCADEKQPTLLFLSRLFVDEKAGIPPGNAELFIFVFDTDHQLVLSRKGEIDLSAMAQRFSFPYYLDSLNPGVYEGRIVIRDTETGQAALGVTKIQLPKPLETGIRLYTPLLLVPGDEALFVRLIKEKNPEESVPSILSYYGLVPQQSSPLVGQLEEGMKRLWVVVPASIKNVENPDVELTVRLQRIKDGQKFILESELLDTKKGVKNDRDILLLEILLPQLIPGDYELEVFASEFTSRAESRIKIPLQKK